MKSIKRVLSVIVTYFIIYVIIKPLNLIAPLYCWWDDTKYDLRVRRFTRVSEKIADEMRRAGIKVREVGYSPSDQSCQVVAQILPEQIIAYQNAYAWAVKKLKRYTPAEVCKGARPQEPLNRDWAIKNGMSEYFTHRYIPCINCDYQFDMNWHWGDDAYNAAPYHIAHNFPIKRTYTCKDGSEKTFPGWLCRNCEKILVGEWKSCSG
ncbi:MAG: hypothetical protein HYT12_03145 [Candidatus Liptonbacteria bacterium]|nr:hypothetical protein [Candidatus Liptonbacteria bacterium]